MESTTAIDSLQYSVDSIDQIDRRFVNPSIDSTWLDFSSRRLTIDRLTDRNIGKAIERRQHFAYSRCNMFQSTELTTKLKLPVRFRTLFTSCFEVSISFQVHNYNGLIYLLVQSPVTSADTFIIASISVVLHETDPG
jgi:hypothetical protein